MLKKTALFLLLACSGLALWAQSQQTGNLVGEATDKDGNPLPGVAVQLSSEALIQDRVVYTNEKGNYKAALLPPGDYVATYSMPGFQTVKQSFVIQIGRTARGNAVLVPSIEEVVEVVATSSALESLGTGVHFSADTVDKLPITSRDMQGIMAQAPGISVGASGDFSIAGSQTSDNTYLLNGANISSPYFGLDQPLYIEEAIQETQVMVSDVSARYGRFTGGVVNAITKSGGNNFEGSLRVELTNQAWDASNPFNNARGVEQSDDISELYQATLGGPIIKDRLWFFLATRIEPETSASQSTIIGEGYTNTTTDDMYEGKLTWAVNPNHTVTVDYLEREETSSDYASFWSIGHQRALGERLDQRELLSINYTGVLSSELYLDVAYTEMENTINSGGAVSKGDPILDGSTFILWNNFWWDYDDTDVRSNETFSADLNWYKDSGFGLHDLHFGVQWVNSITGGLNNQSATGTNILYNWNFGPRDADAVSGPTSFDASGSPIYNFYGNSDLEIWVQTPFEDGQAEMEQTSFYVEDEWTINDHWKTRVGLRYDQFESAGPLQNGAVDNDDFSPRLSVTYDVHGDSTLKFMFTAARYVGRVNDNISNVASGIGNAPSNNYYYVGPDIINLTTDELNSRGGAAADLYDPNNWAIFGAFSPEVSFLDSDIKAPYSNEFTLGMKKEWGRSGWFEATVVSRDYKAMYEDFVGGYGQVTLEDGSILDVTRWENFDHEREYTGLLMSFGKNGDNWSLGGNVTLARLKGTYVGEGSGTPASGSQYGNYQEVQDVQFSNPYGSLPGDVPLRSRLWGSYTWDFGGAGEFTLGARGRYVSGQPYSQTITTSLDPSVAQQTLDILGYAPGANTGWTYYVGGQRGQFRDNDIYDLDFTFRYDLSFWKVNWWAKVDVVSALNRKQLATFNTTVNATSGGLFGLYNNNEGGVDYALSRPSIALGSRFGSATTSSDYTSVRSLQISTGIKF